MTLAVRGNLLSYIEASMQEQEITLTDILTAREERVAIQNHLLSAYQVPVVSFTMNIAGPVKVTALSRRAFLWGMDRLRLGLLQNRLPVFKEACRHLPTGDEGYFAVDAPAETVKALCVELEEAGWSLGRLFDMDVIGTDGRKLERGFERPCLVCGKPGRGCASRRVHSVEQLREATDGLLRAGLAAIDRRRVPVLATQALLEEVSVTPKPGLVDRANHGAHRDMDLNSFLFSANALHRYWELCFTTGRENRTEDMTPAETFSRLRGIGKEAERDMLCATGGVNTHKGAIFTLGILCGALGRLWTAEEGFPAAEALLDEAAAMTRETLEKELPAACWNTAGERLYRKYGTRGIRGEVADGLPAVREISLPVFRELQTRGLDRNHAAAVTLLHLIAHVEDTNLLHRGGPEGAAWAREAAAALIRDGSVPAPERIAELDREFIRRNLSPGGCADLLAVTLFLDSLNRLRETDAASESHTSKTL